MTLRCKPGDLAVVVSSPSGRNLGRILKIVRRHTSNTTDTNGKAVVDHGPRWVIEEPVLGLTGMIHTVADSQVRPIRDPGDDARDEMLRPLPREVQA